MSRHHLLIAEARQEQYRAEMASLRKARAGAATGRKSIRARLASIGRILVASSFGAPTITPGMLTPAVH